MAVDLISMKDMWSEWRWNPQLLNTNQMAYPTDLADPVENLLGVQECQTDFCRSYEKKELQRMF